MSLPPSFPTEAIHRHAKETGMGYAPLKDKAIQVGIEHLIEVLNKHTDRGYLAYEHTSRVATTYQHRPKEAYEANKVKLPTLRVLSYIRNIAGAELEHIPTLQAPNHIAISLRAATKEVDKNRASRRANIPTNLRPKDFAKQVRNRCHPLKYSDILLKHFVPLWEEGVSDWTPILKKQTTSEGHTDIYILNTIAIHAKLLQRGDQQRPNNNLELALSTLITILTLSKHQEYKKLSKASTHKSQKIHAAWLQYINPEALPNIKHTIYETITSHICLERGTTKNRKRHTIRTPT